MFQGLLAEIVGYLQCKLNLGRTWVCTIQHTCAIQRRSVNNAGRGSAKLPRVRLISKSALICTISTYIPSSVVKLEDMLVMHCMTNAVLEYHFYLKFRQQIVLQKEATIRLLFVNKKLFTFVPTNDLI